MEYRIEPAKIEIKPAQLKYGLEILNGAGQIVLIVNEEGVHIPEGIEPSESAKELQRAYKLLSGTQ